MSKHEKHVKRTSRREFLRDTAVVGTGVAAVAAMPVTAVAAVNAQVETDKPVDQGYHLTQHIVDYYKSTV